MSKGIKEIVNEVKNNKEINNKDLLIITLYAMYFTGYTIGWVKRIMEELKENE
ncbi:MAG TPA: hypothetical protein VK982_07965 [Bacteroidales bacterium]|nr:hypothetical protein [Bacteroidales bacterium]